MDTADGTIGPDAEQLRAAAPALQGSGDPRPAATAFGRQMTIWPDGAQVGRYRTAVEDGWNCPVVPQGGLMAALAANAMAAELGDSEQRLRSLTTVFAGQVPAGPVTIDVTALRRGRTMSQLLATVRSEGGAAGHTSVGVFGQPRPGFEFTDVAMPSVPPPDECPSFRDPLPDGVDMGPPFPFWQRVEGRPALGHAPWDEYVPTSSASACWYRFDEPPQLDDGRLDPLAVVALCDLMPSSVGERMGRPDIDWYPPSADLTVHLLGEARSEWLLAHLHARRATDGYASLEIELWDPTEGLVAYGTQVMFFVFPDGPPPPEARRPREPFDT